MSHVANISSYEVDDEVLTSLREYALANNLYWAMAEGHACEISARRNAMENASKNAGEMINKYVLRPMFFFQRFVSNRPPGSRSCTTVSARPPLPASWLRLSPVPLPVRICRSFLLRDQVSFSVDLFIFRSTFSLCKTRVNPFPFHMYRFCPCV
jgi:hypothetical protein